MMGMIPLPVKRPLGGLPLIEVFFRPTAGEYPLQADGTRGIDENQQIAPILKTGLQEQRRINHVSAGVGRPVEIRLPPLLHEGVKEGLKSGALGRILEHDPRDALTVDPAILANDLRAPPRLERIADFLLIQQIPDDRIRVADPAAKFLQDARHGALAGPDAPEQADHQRFWLCVHGRSSGNVDRVHSTIRDQVVPSGPSLIAMPIAVSSSRMASAAA